MTNLLAQAMRIKLLKYILIILIIAIILTIHNIVYNNNIISSNTPNDKQNHLTSDLDRSWQNSVDHSIYDNAIQKFDSLFENLNIKDINNNPTTQYKLNIVDSTFEGITKNLIPYSISATEVMNHISDNYYLLQGVSSKYFLDSGEVNITSRYAALDNLSELILLKDTAEIQLQNIKLSGDILYINLNDFKILSNKSVKLIMHNIEITSDEFIADFSSHRIEFTKNVIMTFGALKLQTSCIIIHYNDHPSKINASNNYIHKISIPTQLKVTNDENADIIVADQCNFDNSTNQIIFTGNIKIYKEDNILNTDKLIYLLDTKVID